MAHPLIKLAERLERRAQARANKRNAEIALSDPHIARDVGLPYRPRPRIKVDLW